MDHWQMFAFFFFGTFIEEILGININIVSIPKIVRYGTNESIVLDCDYDMGRSSNTGLTIKWYIGHELLYQWIHGQPPQASDEYDKYVDVSYRASDNPDTMYRAVKLVKPGPDLSGEYRCVVFTHDDEAEAKGEMLVYTPANHLRIQHLHNHKDDKNKELRVSCIAEGIYPRPNMTLQKDSEVIINQRQDYEIRSDGRFNVEVIADMDTKTLQLPVTLKCKLFIQEANYTKVEEYVYSGSSQPPRLSTLASMVVVFFAFSKR